MLGGLMDVKVIILPFNTRDDRIYMVLFSSINTMFYFYKYHQIREENDLLIFA